MNGEQAREHRAADVEHRYPLCAGVKEHARLEGEGREGRETAQHTGDDEGPQPPVPRRDRQHGRKHHDGKAPDDIDAQRPPRQVLRAVAPTMMLTECRAIEPMTPPAATTARRAACRRADISVATGSP